MVVAAVALPTEACGLGADFGADALVEDRVPSWGDFG
jgi:hypothetical protein